MRIFPHPSSNSTIPVFAVMAMLGGCDPVINIAGANFPGWLLCAVVGIVLAAVLRQLFVVARIEPYIGPIVLIYPCLAVLLACIIWMLFFNRI
jgi:hypothetical protein